MNMKSISIWLAFGVASIAWRESLISRGKLKSRTGPLGMSLLLLVLGPLPLLITVATAPVAVWKLTRRK